MVLLRGSADQGEASAKDVGLRSPRSQNLLCTMGGCRTVLHGFSGVCVRGRAAVAERQPWSWDRCFARRSGLFGTRVFGLG
jgi:hypothetical protein